MNEIFSAYQRALQEAEEQRAAILGLAAIFQCTYGEALVKFQQYVRTSPLSWRQCYAEIRARGTWEPPHLSTP